MKYFALVVMLLVAGCRERGPQLNVLIWSEYLDPQVIKDFEAKFQCRVIIDLHEDSDSMLAKLAAGGGGRYDIVVPGNQTLPSLIHGRLLSPLRHENIPNLKNIDPEFTRLPFDPGNQFGAPYQWGTTGIYGRPPGGKVFEESWALLFDPARQPGPFLLMEEVRSTLGAALKYLGYSLNNTNAEHLAAARDLLVAAKNRSLGFEGGVGGRNRVLSHGAAIAMSYSGDARRGIKEDPETVYFIPREGGEMWLDTLSIPAGAPHRDLAEKFINYILDSQVGARIATFNQLATPNRAAMDFISPEDRANPVIYPPPEVRARLEFARDLGESNGLINQVWTEVKSK